jgi:hypothetical protein
LARVLANRIWQHHFGLGPVATSDNLGYSGSPPSHPRLLEFLACELARSGWSAKALHRFIVTSSVYRQSSAPRQEAVRVDPENRLLARFPLRRLDAEAIRDAMLAISGELDDRMGGPYVPTKRTEAGEVVAAEQAASAGAVRRSVYLQQRRTEVASLLEVFDAPSIVTTCTRRLPSTIPLQSLSLMNSDFVMARARKLAERIEHESERAGSIRADSQGGSAGSSRVPAFEEGINHRPACEEMDQGRTTRVGGRQGETDARITRAFLLTTARAPTREECHSARRFLDCQPLHYPGIAQRDARRRAWVDFCQMLLASNAFLYVE